MWLFLSTTLPLKIKKYVIDSCESMDCSPPGSSVYGILQARILKWVAMPVSREEGPRDQTWDSCIADSLPPEPSGKPLMILSTGD